MNTNVETYTEWRDYYELSKPRVVVLIVFTAVVGMFLSVPGFPDPVRLIFGTIGIGMAASSAAVYNHVLDHRIDILKRIDALHIRFEVRCIFRGYFGGIIAAKNAPGQGAGIRA